MAAGYWGDTIQEFRPGIAFDNYNLVAASTINSRIIQFYSQANRDFWFKAGTYGSVKVRVNWKEFYSTPNVAPTGDTSDPGNSAYTWDQLDSYNAMANLSLLGGNPLILWILNSRSDGIPGWFTTAGYTRTRSDGNICIDYRIAAARTAWKNFITALAARYSSNRKFWCIGFAEQINSTGLTEQQGEAECLNHTHDAFGGRVTVCIPGNSLIYDGIINACYQNLAFYYPDPKLFGSGCTPDCSASSAKGKMQAQFENRPIIEATENNGLNAVIWPDGITNPPGNNSSTPAHVPTAQELDWYFSEGGVVPVHCLVWVPTEWGYSIPSLTLASIMQANDIYMASGATAQGDTVPALPSSYSTTAPSSGTPDIPVFDTANDTDGNGTSGTGKTLTLPTVSEGDLIILVLSTANSSATTGSNFSNISPSFSVAGTSRAEDSTFRPEVSVYTRVSDGTETTVTFDASVDWMAHAITVTDYNPSTPVGSVSTANTAGTAATTITIPGFDTVDDNSSVFVATSYRSGTPTDIDLSTGTKIAENDPPAAVYDSAYFYQDIASQGATGNLTVTNTNASRISGIAIEILGVPTEASDTTAPTLHASSAVTLYDATQTSQDLLWNDATDDTAVIDYILERSLDGSTNWVVHATITQSDKTTNEGSGYSYRAAGLVADTEYYWRYRARDAVPNVSSYSTVSSALSTDNPPDTAAPAGSFIGAESAVYDDDTGDVLVSWTEATDAVDNQSDLLYYVWAYLQSDNVDMDSAPFTHGPFIGVGSIILQDLIDGDYDFGVRVEDTSGNRDTNTALVQETVGVQTYSVSASVLRSASGVYASQEVEYIWDEGTLSYNTSQLREAQAWSIATTDANGSLTITLKSANPGYLNIRTSDGKFWRTVELTPS